MNVIIKILLTMVLLSPQIFAQTGGDTLFTENTFLYHNNCSVLFFDTNDSLIYETADRGYIFGINYKFERSYPRFNNFSQSDFLHTYESDNDSWLYSVWTTETIERSFILGQYLLGDHTVKCIRFFKNFMAEEQRRILQPPNF